MRFILRVILFSLIICRSALHECKWRRKKDGQNVVLSYDEKYFYCLRNAILAILHSAGSHIAFCANIAFWNNRKVTIIYKELHLLTSGSSSSWHHWRLARVCYHDKNGNPMGVFHFHFHHLHHVIYPLFYPSFIYCIIRLIHQRIPLSRSVWDLFYSSFYFPYLHSCYALMQIIDEIKVTGKINLIFHSEAYVDMYYI